MGGGGDTTNVTNTGLGDDQYQVLADNQVGISGQINTVRDDATTMYNSFDGRFGGLDNSLEGLSSSMLDQFGNTNTAMTNSFGAMGGRFDSLDTTAQQNNDAIGGVASGIEGVGSDVTAGFASTEDRFDQVDTANQSMQDGITAGFSDQATGFSDLSGGMTENTTDIRDDISSNFTATNDALANSEANIRGDVETSQYNTLTGQGLLASDLSDLSGANDIYFDTLASSQNAIAEGQDGFRTTFDDYVDRYSDDTTLANQSRADTQTMVANSSDAMREDLGTFAQAAATGQDNLSGQLGDVATATGNDLAALGNTVEGGFNANSIAADQRSENFTSRLGNVKNLLQTTGDNIDANTRSQYENLSNSFDDSGNLIRNSIDDQGNTITRSMNDQGVMMETQFDAAGNQVGQVSTNVTQMLSDAETYQAETVSRIGNNATTISSGFQNTAAGTDSIMNSIGSVGSGINTNIGDIGTQLSSGFDVASQTMSSTSTDYLKQLSTMDSGLSDQLNSQATDVASAFDAQGSLITQGQDELGNTVMRSMDAQGNLLTKKLDANGNEVSSTATNMNQLFTDLGTTMANSQGSLMDTMNTQFSNLDNTVTQGTDGLMSSLQSTETNLGNTMQTNQDATATQFGNLATGQDSVSSQLGDQLGSLQNRMEGGFQNMDANSITQARDMAGIAATQGDLDVGMRQNFKQLSTAFDQTGGLIRNSIDEQGNTISRAVDANGNLLLKSFDVTGNEIGNKVININRSLSDLAALRNVTGANASMGNLSPAMSGATAQGGFASPFSISQ